MIDEKKKVSIFIDTNQLQSFIQDGKSSFVFLATLGIPQYYYDLVNFITDNGLENYIEVCISEVTIRELRQHMINSYNSFLDKLKDFGEKYRKICGDIVEIKYSITYQKENYPSYVDELIKEFSESPKNKCKIISLPNSDTILETLFDKSVRGVKPFVNQQVEGKTYKDGGFKDSVIAETIYKYCAEHNTIGVLISNDGDFGQKFDATLTAESKYVRFNTIEQTIDSLKKYYQTSEEDIVRRKIQDKYYYETILDSVGLKYDDSVTKIDIGEISKEEDEVFSIEITMIINETIYHFSTSFDNAANELSELSYEMEND